MGTQLLPLSSLLKCRSKIDAFFRDGGNNFRLEQFANVARVEQRNPKKSSRKGLPACP